MANVAQKPAKTLISGIVTDIFALSIKQFFIVLFYTLEKQSV